jgi:hypothetical protein
VWRILPIRSETEVTGARPCGGGVEGLEGLEGSGEMLGVFAAGVLDSVIIDNQTEEDRTGNVDEETGSTFCGYVI